MEKNFIWVFNSSALISGENPIFSREYHLPESKLKVPAENLIDNRVWLVLRHADRSYLYGFITITSVEQYLEGLYAKDYLLTAHPYSSARLLPRHEPKESWIIDLNENEGIIDCSLDNLQKFSELIKENTRENFSPTPANIIREVPWTRFTERNYAVPDQLNLTLRTLAYGDIARTRSFPTFVSAFGGIALDVLKRSHSSLGNDESINLIASLDPLGESQIKTVRDVKETIDAANQLPPVTDTFLENIDINKIAPRNFVARSTVQISDWIEKTAKAEIRHENILRDTATYLKKQGYEVKKSSSFDLFAELAGKHYLVEIKSTSSENLVAQGEKGIIQLLRYSIALRYSPYSSARLILLLQYQDQPSVITYLRAMAEKARLDLWLYDENRAWPGRIFNELGDKTF